MESRSEASLDRAKRSLRFHFRQGFIYAVIKAGASLHAVVKKLQAVA